MKRPRLVMLTALIVLGLGVTSTVYLRVMTPAMSETVLMVAGQPLAVSKLFSSLEQRTVVGEYRGVGLDDVVRQAGVGNPGRFDYQVVAADGYRKTISWKDCTEGVLTRQRRTVFPGRSKQFWIRGVTRIEVVE